MKTGTAYGCTDAHLHIGWHLRFLVFRRLGEDLSLYPLVAACNKGEIERERCSGCVGTGSQQLSSKISADELQTKTKQFHYNSYILRCITPSIYRVQ